LLAHGLLRIEMLLPHLPSNDKQCQVKVGKGEGGVLRTMCCIHAPVDTPRDLEFPPTVCAEGKL
jgi:hypothetical protein